MGTVRGMKGCEGPSVPFLKCVGCSLGFGSVLCKELRRAFKLYIVERPGLQYTPKEAAAAHKIRKELSGRDLSENKGIPI